MVHLTEMLQNLRQILPEFLPILTHVLIRHHSRQQITVRITEETIIRSTVHHPVVRLRISGTEITPPLRLREELLLRRSAVRHPLLLTDALSRLHRQESISLHHRVHPEEGRILLRHDLQKVRTLHLLPVRQEDLTVLLHEVIQTDHHQEAVPAVLQEVGLADLKKKFHAS